MQQYSDIYLLLNLAVNKYLHTIASCRISSTYVLQVEEIQQDVTVCRYLFTAKFCSK